MNPKKKKTKKHNYKVDKLINYNINMDNNYIILAITICKRKKKCQIYL